MLRLLHPAAWIGLLINFGLAYVIFSTLLGLDLSVLEGQDREILEALIELVAQVRPFYYAMLAAQAVALGLILTGMRFGMGLAVVSAVFMLPGSLIYLVGCGLTHYQVKYSAFAEAPKGYAGAHFIFPGIFVKRTRVLTMAFLITSLLCLLGGLATGYNTFDLMLIFLGMAIAGAYGLARARRHAALSLHDRHLTLCPALFAPSLLVPYADIGKATLDDNGGILFETHGPQGPAQLLWSLNSVVPEQRRAALEELGAALTVHRVPLY